MLNVYKLMFQLIKLHFSDILLFVIFQIAFLLTLTVNYQKIKMSKELTEYRDAVDLELESSTVGDYDKYQQGYSTSTFPTMS